MENQQEPLSSVTEEYSDKEVIGIISQDKFIILCLMTFGIYEIWWAYKTWRFFKYKDQLDIMPAARALFGIIFLIPLFNKIQSYAREKGIEANYNSIVLFVGIIALNLIARLPDPFWLLALLGFALYIPPYKSLFHAMENTSMDDFEIQEQESFNGRQILLMVIGGILWFLVLAGLMGS